MKIQGKQLADILRSSTDAFTNVHSTTLTTTSIESVSNNNIEIEPHGSGATVIKGNATGGSGRIVLNCENNSHGITLKSPPHSAQATYTLTLPNDTGNADEVLKTDGSGNLDWVAQSGGSLTIEAKTADFTAAAEYFYLVATTSANTITASLPSPSGAGQRIKIFNHGDGILKLRDGGSQIALDPYDSSVPVVYQTFRHVNSRALVELVSTNTTTWEYVIIPQLELDESTLTTTGQVFAYNSTELAMKALPYTFPSADGSASGQVLSTNANGVLSFTTTTDSTKLAIANNLDDLTDDATARTNLGLGNVATLDTGVSDGNVIVADSTGLPAIDGSQLTGVTVSTPVDLADNVKIRLGTGNDFEFFHDGNNSIIKDNASSGGSTIKYLAGTQTFQNKDANKTMAVFNASGAIDLHYDGVKKFETMSAGVKTTGTLNINSAYAFPTSDGNANQILKTDGSGSLSFVDPSTATVYTTISSDVSVANFSAVNYEIAFDTTSNITINLPDTYNNYTQAFANDGKEFIIDNRSTLTHTLRIAKGHGTVSGQGTYQTFLRHSGNYDTVGIDGFVSGAITFKIAPMARVSVKVDSLITSNIFRVIYSVTSTGGMIGSFLYNYITAAQDLLTNNLYLCNGTFTVTLPNYTFTEEGERVEIKNVGAGTISVYTGNNSSFIDSSYNSLNHTKDLASGESATFIKSLFLGAYTRNIRWITM